MKYIFDARWYETAGREALNLNPDDHEPEPRGGWKRWTLKNHLVYVNERIIRKEEFTLVGDIDQLEKQPENAGNGETRCRIGAVALILYKSGYTVYGTDADEPNRVLEFVLEDGYDIPYALEIEAINYLSDARTAGEFWNRDERKEEYCYMLNVITRTGR